MADPQMHFLDASKRVEFISRFLFCTFNGTPVKRFIFDDGKMIWKRKKGIFIDSKKEFLIVVF
jgi:hypothetical protein